MPPGLSSDRLADQPQPGEILSVALTAPEGGVLSVDPMEIPRGARVAIGRADPDGTTSIAVYQATAETGKTTPMEVQVTAPSGVTLDVANSFAGPETFDLTRPRPYVFVSALDTDTFIDVTPNEGKPLVFGDEIEVDRLSFARVMEVEGEVARRLSTVLGGTVFLESLGGKAYPLRRGEHLDLALEFGGDLFAFGDTRSDRPARHRPGARAVGRKSGKCPGFRRQPKPDAALARVADGASRDRAVLGGDFVRLRPAAGRFAVLGDRQMRFSVRR